MKTENNKILADQEQALSLYVESLLGGGCLDGNDFTESDTVKTIDSSPENSNSEGICSEQSEQVFANQPKEEQIVSTEQDLSEHNNTEPLAVEQIISGQVAQTQATQEQVKTEQQSGNLEHSSFEQVAQETSEQTSEKTNSSEQATVKMEPVESCELSEVNQEEAPRLDLSLFLPKIPTPEELEIIEKKEQDLLNLELKKELEKTRQDNTLLKGKLEESLKKLDDYGKTHTEVYAPDWAHPSFQVMLFNVGNLKLAIPVNDLSSIVVWNEKYLNQMPGSESWYLGLIQHLGKSVPVIDTLQQVVPPERLNSFIKKRGEFSNIILIEDSSWGLVCEEVIGIITLSAEEVKWRSNRTSRRWLFGTVKEHMCALLDTGEFASMLRTGEDSLIDRKTK